LSLRRLHVQHQGAEPGRTALTARNRHSRHQQRKDRQRSCGYKHGDLNLD